MLKIYHQNINLRVTVDNSKSSVVIFPRNIQLLMSPSIVLIDEAFGVIHCFHCNHIPFNFATIVLSPNSRAIFLTFYLTANAWHLWSFFSQSPSPQKRQFGMKFRKSVLLWLIRTSIGSDSEGFSGASKTLNDSACFSFRFNFCLSYTDTQDLWNTTWFSINTSAKSSPFL